MNISRFIKPILIGREDIDDSKWLITISATNKSYARIQCQNKYKVTTRTRKIGSVTFNIILFMYKNGNIEFNVITLGQGGLNTHTYHKIVKDELYDIFSDLKKLNCTT